ncbi:hypothetical protein SNE40_004587 [Patella caerulea]|uniref:Uncharacterized protein n=1 Tax=Patella caerulea TaxID=87958 RepID=A0AAN8PYA1_PATCE
MEGNILIDSDDFLLVLPNEPDRCDVESGIGSLSSDEDLRSSFSTGDNDRFMSRKPKRRVQFQSEEHLVLIREIPPRGFYDSDVSDDDSCSDDEDEDDDGDDNGDGGDESDESESSCESDDAEDTEPKKVVVARNEAAKGSYNVERSPRKSVDRISKITSMALLPGAKKTAKPKGGINSEKKTRGSRKQRVKKSGQVHDNSERTAHRLIIADGKKRKYVPKVSSVANSTSSSRNKETPRLKVITYASAPLASAKFNTKLIRSKTPTRISIDSPVPIRSDSNLNHKRTYSWEDDRPASSCDYSPLSARHYNNVYNMNDLFSPRSPVKAGHLPDIGSDETRTRTNLKPFPPRHKQYNAWQVANGNLDAKSLHTPRIAPMWENVQSISSGKSEKSKSLTSVL